MEDNRQKPGFFVRLATLIVDKRNLFFLLYTAGIIFSLISQGWVQVNNDITDYLPEETETRQGLQLMEDEFTTFGTARVMISNITYENAEELTERLSRVGAQTLLRTLKALENGTLTRTPQDESKSSYQPMLEIMKKYGVSRCYYGHLHGESLRGAFSGERDGVSYQVVSADYLRFRPVMIKP